MNNISDSPMPKNGLFGIRWRFWILAALGIVLLSLGLAWISSRSQSIQGWSAFLGAFLLAAGILGATWWLLRSENPPSWLGKLLLGAVLLRLGAGVLWFIALPNWGHGSLSEKAGYVMTDASQRDQVAWKLAQSNRPLWTAFRDNRRVDQYGGLLFLSALIYRSLGDGIHPPLLIVVFTATLSALAVIFTWAFAHRVWDERTAWLAAWIIALYPEAVLLGSSQMREAFTVTLTVAAFYGLVRYQNKHSWGGLAWIFIPLAFSLMFSPPFAALLLGMLTLAALVSSTTFSRDILHQRRFWLILAGMVALVTVGLWLALRQLTPEGMSNPVAMLSWWIRKSASLQAYLSQHASDWMQKTFKSAPEWMHLPLLLGYGVVQPFLPAALTVGSQSPIWPWITLWRAIGWTLMLPFLIAAPFLALRKQHERSFTLVLSLIVWAGILIASFRGGGDMWDNPRYRQAFAGLQAGLAAWAWVEHRRNPDIWLRRALISLIAILSWFLPWYLRRYTPLNWPIADFFKTLGLGIATAFLLGLWDWTRTDSSRKADSALQPLDQE